LASASKRHWTTIIGQAAAHPAAFGVVLLYTLLWLILDRESFDWNAVATLAIWIMTLFIQRANRRDTLALHAKSAKGPDGIARAFSAYGHQRGLTAFGAPGGGLL
jgi:hypothetical protein